MAPADRNQWSVPFASCRHIGSSCCPFGFHRFSAARAHSGGPTGQARLHYSGLSVQLSLKSRSRTTAVALKRVPSA